MKGGIRFVVFGEPVPKARHRMTVINGFARAYPDKATEKAEAIIAGAFASEVGHARVGIYQEPVRAKPATRATKHKIALPSRPGVPGKWIREPTFATQQVELELELYFGRSPIADIDNCLKTVLDALNRKAWRDDNRVMKVLAEKFFEQAQPRTVVRIKRRGDPGVPCSECGGPFTFRDGPGDDAITLHPGLGIDVTRYIHARCI